MIELDIYRQQIGYFNQYFRFRKKFIRKQTEYIPLKLFNGKKEEYTPLKLTIVYCMMVLFVVQTFRTERLVSENMNSKYVFKIHSDIYKVKFLHFGVEICFQNYENSRSSCLLFMLSPNFYAKLTYGNKQATKKGLKNLHLNIRSIRNKIAEVRNIVEQKKPHIFGLSECELRKSKTFDEKQIKLPGYDILYPKSWLANGYARVLVYIKSSLEYEQLFDLETESVQSIWVKGGFKNTRKILFCHMYREHTCSLGNSLRNQKENLEKLLLQWENASELKTGQDSCEIHIMGDMNLDAMYGNWLKKSYHLYSLSKMVQVACKMTNLTQLVCQPTRCQFNAVTGQTSMSCIDHVYTNCKARCSEVVITSFGNSDHDLVEYTRYAKDPPMPARTIKKRSYKNFILNDFLDHLSKIDWTPVYVSQDIDQAVEIFTSLFSEILNIHAPFITYQQRKHFSPWVTKETIGLMKTRDQAKAEALNLAKQGNDSSGAWLKFKTLRNKINNRLKFEEISYKRNNINACLGDPAKVWSTAKSYMNWNSSDGPPSQLWVGGALVTKASIIAAEMNDFFINKVDNIRKSIAFIPNNFSKCYELMRGKHCKLWLQHVTVDKVTRLLKKLKNSKSTGVDGLDSYCIKVSAELIAQPLHHIVCLSIIQCKFPTMWKFSKIIPLHKKDSKLERSNYRPVAILSPLSKILERIVYSQVYQYFSRNKLFHKNLHGYRKNRSTQSALLTMYDRWVRASSQGDLSGVVLIDLSAAFDLVDHNLLLKKLEIYGLQQDCLKWISSYLDTRYQAVWIDHVLSSFLSCDVGVPQGSILGPLFFLIFFSDLLSHGQSEIDSYADDTTVTQVGRSIQEIELRLNQDCQKISQWMKANKLKMNPGKTHVLLIGTQRRLAAQNRPLEVCIDGEVIKNTDSKSQNLLGCEISPDLKWTKHITSLQTKLAKRLTALNNLKLICSYSLRKTLAEGLFNSVVGYCLPVFGGMEVGDQKVIQLLQNRAARLVCQAPPRSNRSDLYRKLGWLTINQMTWYYTLVSLFKVRSLNDPEYLAFQLGNDGRNGRINTINPKLTVVSSSFCFRGPSQWNILPSSIRNECRLGSFKIQVKKWILTNVPQFLD